MSSTFKLLGKTQLTGTAATITFSSLPTGYSDLCLVASVRSARSTSTDDLELLINGSTSGMSRRSMVGTGSAVQAVGPFTGATLGVVNSDQSNPDTFTSLEVYVPDYTSAGARSISATLCQEANATGAFISATTVSDSGAITAIGLDLTLSSFVSGSSAYLYGITKA